MNKLFTHILNDLRLEFRNLYQLLGLLIFSWMIAYIVSRIHPSFNERHFNFIFWTFILMFSISICLRSVGHYTHEEYKLLYLHISPNIFYLSTLIFNLLYLFVVSLFFYGVLILLIAPVVIFKVNFIFLIFIASFVISTVLSFLSSLNQASGGQHTLMSIISIPVLIPVILLLNNIGLSVILSQMVSNNSYLALLGISMMTVSLSMVLFSYTWKE